MSDQIDEQEIEEKSKGNMESLAKRLSESVKNGVGEVNFNIKLSGTLKLTFISIGCVVLLIYEAVKNYL